MVIYVSPPVFPTLVSTSNRAVNMARESVRMKDEVKSNLEDGKRTFLNELKSFENGGFLDLGHPLLNRIADTFIKAAGIGVIQAVSKEAYFTAVEGLGLDVSSRKTGFPDLRGETSRKSMEALVKNSGKESLQWGLAAGTYSGLTYGLREARGSHDWKNSAVAGALTGVALALASDDVSHERIAECAITGAAVSTAANLLTGIF